MQERIPEYPKALAIQEFRVESFFCVVLFSAPPSQSQPPPQPPQPHQPNHTEHSNSTPEAFPAHNGRPKSGAMAADIHNFASFFFRSLQPPRACASSLSPSISFRLVPRPLQSSHSFPIPTILRPQALLWPHSLNPQDPLHYHTLGHLHLNPRWQHHPRRTFITERSAGAVPVEQLQQSTVKRVSAHAHKRRQVFDETK